MWRSRIPGGRGRGGSRGRKKRWRAPDILRGWAIQAREARALYPGLDLAVEAGEPRFLQLLGAGVDVRTAYEVVHRDEILSGAMQYAARQAARKTAEDIRARGARPLENGATGSAGSAPGRLHVRDMDRAQAEIAKAAHRVRRPGCGKGGGRI